MNNTPAIIRTLIIYAVIVPLAIWIGYLLTDLDSTNLSTGGILALVLCIPLLLRWHHLLLVASWNLVMMMFFLPGNLLLWLPMTMLSLLISILHRSLNSEARFLRAPSITQSLVCLMAVVYFTAEMTGGIGLKAMGSETAGGKRYIYLLVAILGYFAMTARRIPPNRAGLYIAVFFLGNCSQIIGDLTSYLPGFVFAFFPASGYSMDSGMGVATNLRYGGLGIVGQAIFTLMLARYGVRGIFLTGKLGRMLLFFFFSVLVLYGGFRSITMTCVFIFIIQFFMERLHRSNLFPVFIFSGIIAATLLIPFANKLPYTFQRSLAFLTLKISNDVRLETAATQGWRLQMWKAVMPQVPQYLLLGKGYGINATDYSQMGNEAFQNNISADNWMAAVAGNFHNGPLSVLINFGAWGAIAVLWFWIASLRALFDNYRYGDPPLQLVNGVLFALFLAKIITFLTVFGSIYSDMNGFVGYIAMSVSLNGGVCRRATATAKAVKQSPVPLPTRPRPRFQPSFPR